MVDCELCEKKYSEKKYLAHLNKCIQKQELFTKEGIVNEKVPILFKLLRKYFSSEKIISFLNSAHNNDYKFKKEPIDSYQELIFSGGWTPFLYDTAPDLITFAYLHALRSKNHEISTIARNNIASMFLYLTKNIYLSPYEEVKPGILSFLVSILRYREAQDLLKQEYRAMNVVEKYDLKRWASRVVDEHSPYSEHRERMNKEKENLASFISKIYWDNEKEKIWLDKPYFDIMKILYMGGWIPFEYITVLVNDLPRKEIDICLDILARKGLVNAEKRIIKKITNYNKPTLYFTLTLQGINLTRAYRKSFDKITI